MTVRFDVIVDLPRRATLAAIGRRSVARPPPVELARAVEPGRAEVLTTFVVREVTPLFAADVLFIRDTGRFGEAEDRLAELPPPAALIRRFWAGCF